MSDQTHLNSYLSSASYQTCSYFLNPRTFQECRVVVLRDEMISMQHLTRYLREKKKWSIKLLLIWPIVCPFKHHSISDPETQCCVQLRSMQMKVNLIFMYLSHTRLSNSRNLATLRKQCSVIKSHQALNWSRPVIWISTWSVHTEHL